MDIESALYVINTILWGVFAFTGVSCMRLGRRMRDEAEATDAKTVHRMQLLREASALAKYGAHAEAEELLKEACAP